MENLNPIFEDLYTAMQSAETSYSILIKKLNKTHFKQNGGDPNWYDVVLINYETEIPLHITRFFEFIKITPPPDIFAQIFETKTGKVSDVVSLQGALDYFVENSAKIKNQILEYRNEFEFEEKVLSIKSSC